MVQSSVLRMQRCGRATEVVESKGGHMSFEKQSGNGDVPNLKPLVRFAMEDVILVT